MLKVTQRTQANLNQISFDLDFYFTENKKNKNLIYYSNEKCKSLEYVFDTLVNDIALVIYEDLEENNIYIIKTNITTETMQIDIKSKNFNIKKLEDIINLILFKQGIEKVYFLDNTQLDKKINIQNAKKEYIPYKKFKEEVNKSPTLKTKQNYTIFTVSFFIILLLINTSFNQLERYLNNQKTKAFNDKYTILEEKILSQEEEIRTLEEKKDKKIAILKNIKDLKLIGTIEDKGFRK